MLPPKPFRCPSSVLLPEDTVMSVIHAAAEGHVGVCDPSAAGDHAVVCGPCYHQKLCGCLWSVILPEAILVSVARAVAGDHVDVLGDHAEIHGTC